MDIYGEERERRKKDKIVSPTGGGEAKTLENIEALYASVRSWGTEE